MKRRFLIPILIAAAILIPWGLVNAGWFIHLDTSGIRAWLNTPSEHTSADRVVTSASTQATCKGEYEKHRLTASPTFMEDGADCWFDYGVKAGTVRFIAADGGYQDVDAGREIKFDRHIKFVKWQAVGGEAVIHAVFCDLGKSWDGKRCS